MIPFHVQILTTFTYRVEHKPIFKSHESHLLMKGLGTETQLPWILIGIIFDDRNFSSLFLSVEGRWGDLKGR